MKKIISHLSILIFLFVLPIGCAEKKNYRRKLKKGELCKCEKCIWIDSKNEKTTGLYCVERR